MELDFCGIVFSYLAVEQILLSQAFWSGIQISVFHNYFDSAVHEVLISVIRHVLLTHQRYEIYNLIEAQLTLKGSGTISQFEIRGGNRAGKINIEDWGEF